MLLGGMGCLVSHLAAKLAFFPPRPSTYQVKKQEDGKLVVVSSTVSHDDSSMDVRVLDTKRGNKIVAFYMKNPYARLTLLYSHGNAADLGQLYDLFAQLKINLRVNLMGYDYSGYGASTGKPSEYDTYADIEAVYECLQTEYGISQEDLILYGQSVGSGPTLHLAAKLPRLRGVVLHSAILSGLRVLCQLKVTFCFDIYKNINKIRKVKCPVLVIHGTEDDVVNWFHGNGLWKLSRDPYEPLWIKGGGHCNLELYPDYVRHLSGFVKDMENQTTKTRLKKIKQNLRKPLKSSTHTTNGSKKCCRIRCCRVKIRFRRPKCLKCSRPKCLKCSGPNCLKCLRPNCLKCSTPKCLKCSTPKCLKCLRPNCWKCSCLKCSGPNCLKCLRPNCWKCSCLKCLRPNCWKCSCLKCSGPNCLTCLRPNCWKCSGSNCLTCLRPNCWKCSCLKCSEPKCLKCSGPKCLKCTRPKCCCIKLFCWC